MKRWLSMTVGITIATAILLVYGCSSSLIRYVITEPPVEAEIDIKGLEPKDKIIEVSDVYNGSYCAGDTFWVVVKRKKKYLLGKIDIRSGNVNHLVPMEAYDPRHPIYWTTLEENQMGFMGKVKGSFLARMTGNGTTDKYGFEAEKVFWGEQNHLVSITYQWKKNEDKMIDIAYENSASTQRFLIGNDVIDMLASHGYNWAFFRTGNVRKCRFYPAGDNTYLGIEPNTLEDTYVVTFVVFDTQLKESWGADLDFRVPYVDGAVTRDEQLVGIVVGKPGSYSIKQYPVQSFVRNVKLHKAIQ
ncbi:MAG: hypothetical protein D6748_16460 [Calditrichaeota bacterium]|nr:MAG: hypothetical protein D6748_16460 [Calditrichota bacterium]